MKHLKRLLNLLYWTHVGQLTIAGKFNGKTVVLSLDKGQLKRLYVGPKGKIENLTCEFVNHGSQDFKNIIEIYEQSA